MIMVKFGLILLLVGIQSAKSQENSSAVCTLQTFSGDENAFRACSTLYALQYNWYPSPIAGLYSYQAWNGFDGFWQNGVVLETLANWMEYANNTMYSSVVQGSLRDVYSLLEAYYPQPSFDDMAWYGLSYLRIYEVTGNKSFLDRAQDIYKWVWKNGWDRSGSCGGGFWFDQTEGSKQTIENVQMLMLGSKLHRLTAKQLNKTKRLYLEYQIYKIWRFIEKSGIINSTTNLVADGVTINCTSNQIVGPSYNMGVTIGALVEAAQVFAFERNSFITLAHKIAEATIKNMTQNGVLVEWCTPNCNDDAKVFKGIFLRNLRYLMDFTSTASGYKNQMELYKQFLHTNSQSVWMNDRCEPEVQSSNCTVVFKDGPSAHSNISGPVFSEDFRGPFNYSATMQQACVLDLFVSAIQVNTTCTGKYCNYDPPIPPPRHLTCKDNPCPPDQPCCQYYNDYYTCCESTQQCVNGECV